MNRGMNRIRSVALVLALTLGLAACPASPYHVCVKGSADVASAIGAGENSVDQARQQGSMTAAEERAALTYLNLANKLNGQFQTCVAAAHSAGDLSGSFTSCTSAFATGLVDPAEQAALHITSVGGKKTLTTIVNSVQLAVTGITAALGGK
jgi:hypothetical protein